MRLGSLVIAVSSQGKVRTKVPNKVWNIFEIELRELYRLFAPYNQKFATHLDTY